MSPSYKIRLLLFVLILCCAGTALTLRLTFHKEDILKSDGREIELNLQKKEKFILRFLGDSNSYNSLKTINTNKVLAEKLVPELSGDLNYLLFTYVDNQLVFWSSDKIVPVSVAGLAEGSSFKSYDTGYFEAIKKTQGNFSAVFYIPVKSRYPFENQYLRDVFSPDLITENNLEIATKNDRDVYQITNSEGENLFSVKLKSANVQAYYSRLELWAWAITILLACIFTNYLCAWIASEGYVKSSVAILLTFFIALSFISIKYSWFYNHFNFKLFAPENPTANLLIPSTGDFFLVTVWLAWVLFFTYSYRSELRLTSRPPGRLACYIIFAALVASLFFIAAQTNTVFHRLVSTSNNNFDVINIMNLDTVSWLSIVMLCISILNIYMLIDIVLAIGGSLAITNLQRLIIFLTVIAVTLVIKIVANKTDMLFLLFAVIMFVRGWSVYKKAGEFSIGFTVTTVLFFAIFSSVKLAHFQNIKELGQRKHLSKQLESANDLNANSLFRNMENGMLKDQIIINSFKPGGNHEMLNSRLKEYFGGYLGKYEFTSITFKEDEPLPDEGSLRATERYKRLVLAGSQKVSSFFYHITNTFGSNNYFAILPVEENNYSLGTLFIELKSKTFFDPGTFPKVLVDGRINDNTDYRDYSFAFYKDSTLIGQYGRYVYNLLDDDFSGSLKKFVFFEKNNYSHLLYQPNSKTLIVVSRPLTGMVLKLASVSFLFLVLLVFFSICALINWLWQNLLKNNTGFHNLRWNLLISNNRVLYKTRIQVSMIAAVVSTLVLLGIITCISIGVQYQEQQQQSVLENVNKIAAGFEKKMFKNGEPEINEKAFSEFAELIAANLNYFSPDGKLLYTTQPKIYDNNLLGRRINALAYIYLNKFNRSEYLNKDEQLGSLHYISAYKPIRNSSNQTIGYLALPYFSNQHDIEARIGQFLNTLINVYALVFVAIGFFAVFIANQITEPLTLVQKSLSQTKIGRKNEPIVWKRNDEIGSLVKEYNIMIAALEESAMRLASSERETAWKEMAKQVAHEIKNPLTPLKLGVQLLEKSWRENDPNFNKKFEKFSKSFIEQIESLSHIASEFSNFAKMPETSLENVAIREVIEQSMEVYSKVEQITITLEDNVGTGKMIRGDKDQLLRCFNNLIKNAIEANSENRNGAVKIVIDQNEGFAHIQINDNGKGIPEGLRERIFNPNFTTKSSGTGLGLAFVKQAIGNMAGTVGFVTELNKGTTFFITLPLVS